ncbi:MAG: hypothetical protein JW863_06920 [Chitinispirillaceae bacterium]|nr:hypothetical protein [Chitinispirillaceae bacterium]
MKIDFLLSAAVAILAAGALFHGDAAKLAPPAWQNPDIGFTLDGVADMNDLEDSWKSPGVSLRGAELVVSANIDPYASLLGNVLISEHGAELHEAYAEFPYLPLNLKGKIGLMHANFGRWNRFHVHMMPFTSTPRIYLEYAGGLLALTGAELSWMLPVDHYIELTLSAYDRIQGHTHDVDPSTGSSDPSMTAQEVAEQIGAEQHGSHWHGPDGEIYYENDLLALAGELSSADPVAVSGNRRPDGFAYGGRITTTFEFGPQISIDAGASGIYQHRYKQTRREELDGRTYGKLLYGADITLFWHPLSANKYRNLQIGVEMLGSYEGFERSAGNRLYEDYYQRTGIFNWAAWRQTERWQFGIFGEWFAANDYTGGIKRRAGGFATIDITHYQYVRLEYSRYDYPGVLDGVNRIMLQYDATIGYHTHGRQR